MVSRFDIYLVNLDPQPSADPKNTRPCIVISPDELNRNLDTVTIAPVSSTKAAYPTRLPVVVLGSERFVILDQIRTVEKTRLAKKIGEIEGTTRSGILSKLQEIFAE